jgi:predicted alpha/beta superfamily hydrolase
MQSKGPKTMSKAALVIWLTMPLLIVGVLAMMMDRSQGKPNPRIAAIEQARLPGQAADSPRDQASIDRDIAETKAHREAMAAKKGGDATDAEPPAEAPKAATPAAKGEPNLVQPESLPQGFILVVEDKSKQSSNESPIYVPSSHNGWNPADQNMKMTRRSDMRWQIVLPKPELDSKMAFKFARGSWDLVEVDAKFADIENRMLPLVDASKLGPDEKPVIELVIEGWKDHSPAEPAKLAMNPYRPIVVSAGAIKRVEVVGGGGFIKPRDLLVWLPPGYDDAANAKRTYPVLYMQDGQNIFEKLPGLPAEWGADETAAKLIADKKIEPIIIVAIPNTGAGRMNEYSPVAILDGVTPRGAEYVDFLVREVKPRIDSAFRTKPDAANTAVGGSSLGGLISLEAATEHPEVFGKVLAESTPLVSKNRAAFNYFAKKKDWPKLVYFGMGGMEAGKDAADKTLNGQYAASAQAFGELLKGHGFSNSTLMIKIDPDAVHNEEAWAKRFPDALMFLFPPKAE